MSNQKLLILTCLGLALLLAACTRSTPTPTIIPLVDADAQIANPASVYCEQYGGTLEIRTDESGGQKGICIFADGSECEEWAYMRGECAPASAYQDTPTPAPPSTAPATPTPETAASGWKIYRNGETGLYFEYPPEATIELIGDTPRSLSIFGQGGWPVFYVSFPSNREDFRPPEGTDLAQWLNEHNLIINPRVEDVQIAGETAIHTRFDRSQQAFANDGYFFSHVGQLYGITIHHQDDREDWELYNRFLDSFRFEK